MREEIRLPKLGDTANEVAVVEWHVEVGSVIAEGDPLITVETDKVEVEVPSPLAGKVVERLVTSEDEIAVGTPIAVVEF